MGKKEDILNRYSPVVRRVMLASSAIGIAAVTVLGTARAYADVYQQQIDNLQQQNSQISNNVSALQDQATSYQDAINQLQAAINSLQAQINANTAQQAQLQKDIEKAEADLAQQKDLLGKDIKAMYVEGDISTLEMLASSNDISEFVDKQQYHNSVKDKITETLTKINDLKHQLSGQKDKVTALLKQQQGQQADLASNRAKQANLLSYNQSQQASYNQQSQDNQSKIAQLKAQQAAAYAAYARSNGSGYSIGEPGNGGYPSKWANATQDSLYDNWGMYNRECVSYVAWKVDSTGRYMPYGLGNAADWARNAKNYNINSADGKPIVGSVVMWGSNDGLGYLGHVAYVEVVNSDNSIEVSQYNFIHGQFSRMHVPASTVSRLTFIYF